MAELRTNIVKVFLSLVLAGGLFPVFPMQVALASPSDEQLIADNIAVVQTAEEARSDGLIIVYKSEALDLDEPIDGLSPSENLTDEVSGGNRANEGPSGTLEDLGVVSQDVISDDSQQGSVAVAQLDDDVSPEKAIAEIESLAEVEFVQPNYSYSLLTAQTNDPYIVEQDSDYQYYLQETRTLDAWDYAKTNRSVTVAVIDTGANLNHPDLKQNLNTALAYDVISDTKLINAGIVNSGDANGHGTMVAGIVSAEANNGIGIAGTSYNARVLPIRVFDEDNRTSTANLIAAYSYLQKQIDIGALTDLRVINMSLGYYAQNESDMDRALRESIASMLRDYGVVTVCAGGNGNARGQMSADACYPSDFEECISVVASDRAGKLASFSDMNSSKDIAAPGVNVISTSAQDGYASATGTSAAAPQVSATLALMFAAKPSLSAQEAKTSILDTAGIMENSEEVGILNAQAALAQVLGTEVDARVDGQEKADTPQNDDVIEELSNGEITFVDPSAYETSGIEESTEESIEANSWRYSNGIRLESVFNGIELGIIRPLDNTIVGWTKSNGTSSVTTGNGTRVSINGVKRVGVDVSSWQGKIDWAKVKADGISFAILRCASWDSKNSRYVIDPQFINNVKGARQNGIEIGVYLFSYADKVTGATKSSESEAKFVLSFLEQAGLSPNSLALPVFYDMELDTQASYGKAQLGKMAKTFCDAISAKGYSVGIYANQNWWNNYLTDPVFSDNSWKRWVARYPISASVAQQGTGISNTAIWQFSSRGTVNGISGNVDMDFDFVGDDGYPENSVIYSAHSSGIGWMNYKANGAEAGTTGQSKALEALKIKLARQSYTGSIEYRAHVQNIGWQNWVASNAVAGTTGKSLRAEAISIRLTGEMANKYDVYYCVHAQNLGWMGWAKNGENAGTAGYGYRLEAIKVKLVPKGGAAPESKTNAFQSTKVSYSPHVQGIGWQSAVKDGVSAGTTGRSKRLEAVKISLENQDYSGGIEYRTHIQNIGWESGWKSNGAMSGTSGRALRLEAIQIRLTGEMAKKYDVYYRVHAQNLGWMGWAKNGASAGTAGYSYRLEAIQIKLVPKGSTAPGSTVNTFQERA